MNKIKEASRTQKLKFRIWNRTKNDYEYYEDIYSVAQTLREIRGEDIEWDTGLDDMHGNDIYRNDIVEAASNHYLVIPEDLRLSNIYALQPLTIEASSIPFTQNLESNISLIANARQESDPRVSKNQKMKTQQYKLVGITPTASKWLDDIEELKRHIGEEVKRLSPSLSTTSDGKVWPNDFIKVKEAHNISTARLNDIFLKVLPWLLVVIGGFGIVILGSEIRSIWKYIIGIPFSVLLFYPAYAYYQKLFGKVKKPDTGNFL